MMSVTTVLVIVCDFVTELKVKRLMVNHTGDWMYWANVCYYLVIRYAMWSKHFGIYGFIYVLSFVHDL